MSKKYKIIVTGSTGFVGRRLIKLLVKKYNSKDILCLIWDRNSNLEKSGRKILKDLKLNTKKIDLVTGQGLKNLPKSPKLIIHLAANTDTNEKDHRVNDIGVKNLLDAFSPIAPDTHIIHISTMVAMSGRKNCSKPFSESNPLSPNNEYTRTKANGEKIILERQKKENFRLTILRPNTIYGSGMRPDSLFDFVKKLILKKSLLARLNWPGLSSLICVDDVAKAILLAVNNPPKPGKNNIFFLHGENITLAEISRQLHQKLNTPYKVIVMPKLFWSMASLERYFIPILEKVTNPKTFNLAWRASLIVENVIYCNSTKMKKTFPTWSPRKLSEEIKRITI
ncbi:MAG TPA: NAD(P)-dependent oxidoreductase [Patescibacteria group bacterium]